MSWQELVVFSRPRGRLKKHIMFNMSKEQCEAVKELLKYTYPTTEVPTPDEFTEVYAPKVIETLHDEVSPFPDMNRARMAMRILRGGKIFQWTKLRLGIRFKDFEPFAVYRGHDGVSVFFIEPKWPLVKKPVLYCRRDCWIGNTIQCAAFGSYSQIELNSAGILPLWTDRCSVESALTCPMRLAAIKGGFPKASLEDPVVKAFQEWCKTRKGYSK